MKRSSLGCSSGFPRRESERVRGRGGRRGEGLVCGVVGGKEMGRGDEEYLRICTTGFVGVGLV